jgi:hypothetical protein
MAIKNEIEFFRGEQWKVLRDKNALGANYAISNYGRLVCFTKHLNSGHELKLSRQQGFPIWRARKDGKYFAILIHRLVAKYYLPKPVGKQKFIIHKNHNKEDNYFNNLKWATQEEVTQHNKKNPVVKAAKEKARLNPVYPNGKLTPAKVIIIKSLLAKNKTLKEIALKFGISDMQVHRIKTGENWGLIK